MFFISMLSGGIAFAFGSGTLNLTGTASVEADALYKILYQELYAEELTANIFLSEQSLFHPYDAGDKLEFDEALKEPDYSDESFYSENDGNSAEEENEDDEDDNENDDSKGEEEEEI